MAVNENIFVVDWNKLVSWLIPADLRKSKTLAFARALVAGVMDLYDRFLNYRDYTNYWLAITPQVCYMEKALNDRYDYASRRIRITEGEEKLGFPLFLSTENKPVVFSQKSEGNPQVMYTKGETAQFTVDFIVQVPAAVAFDTDEMTEFVKQMKLASKTFKIMIV